ncbi:MAG: sodium:calcium antiporter, partial [Rhodothermales bacterium]|nr:sodium:calcium antiporter [Rhodothermales bacterium]
LQPMRVHGQLLKLDVPMMLGSSSLLVVMLLDGHLGRLEGGSLFAMLVLYLGYNVWKARTERKGLPPALAAPDVPASLPVGRALFYAGGGLALLALGADLLVDGAVVMARAAGLSEAVVGLTIVAIGTSLPELATSLVATLRGEGDIALGNVVGSNIFNVLGILGISALVHPLERGGVAPVDLLVMLAASVLLLPLLRSGLLLARWEGALLLSVYTIYVVYLL